MVRRGDWTIWYNALRRKTSTDLKEYQSNTDDGEENDIGYSY
jgi:hypothetical protein